MPPLPESFWRWTTSALLAGLLAILTISWQASRHEHEALTQVTEWTNRSQDTRIERMEVREEDLRRRLTELEGKHTYDTLAQLLDLRKRMDRLETRLYRLSPETAP